MNVTIDATSLLLPAAGVQHYVHYWFSSLLEASREQGSVISAYPPGFAIGLVPDHEESLRGTLGLTLVRICNIRGNPLLRLMLTGADVFHASQHTANMPKCKNVTATVFDLSCWTTPELHTPANIAATRRYGDTILKAGDGLIAISSHTRNDAMEILGIPGERIRVIYPGIAEPFFEVTPEQAERVRTQYRLNSPYMLFVGCIEPRKNVPVLIRAYQSLPEYIRRDVQLVIAGPFGWESQEVCQMLTNSGSQVRYLGYVPEPDLPGLFRGSMALIYPSQYEGFGFPAAQAMAAGAPVITSNNSSLPEVVGDAGLLVNPNCFEELADAMERLVTHPALARDLASRGVKRAQLFRWPATALQSLQFFRDVAGK
jgi:alpha-1,3-rhamnosyl/mannosyltransferase